MYIYNHLYFIESLFNNISNYILLRVSTHYECLAISNFSTLVLKLQ